MQVEEVEEVTVDNSFRWFRWNWWWRRDVWSSTGWRKYRWIRWNS
jgi:hypothetical protein